MDDIWNTEVEICIPRLPYILGESYVFVMAPGIVIAAVFTMLYGRTVDRRGFLRAVLLPLAHLPGRRACGDPHLRRPLRNAPHPPLNPQ